MRIKKFNTAVAVGALAASVLWWNWGKLTGAVTDGSAALLAAGSVATSALPGDGQFQDLATADLTETVSEDDFSAAGKQVTVIPWQNQSPQADEMPSRPVLQKWTVGKRTYYQMTGPINRDFIGKPVGGWGSHLAYEAYFPRGGRLHDHWIIGPPQAVMGHYDRPVLGDPGWYAFRGYTNLTDARYRMQVEGSQVTVTFWCYSNDTPGHIVFNYNSPTAGIQWFSTGRAGGRDDWMNHRHQWWSNP